MKQIVSDRLRNKAKDFLIYVAIFGGFAAFALVMALVIYDTIDDANKRTDFKAECLRTGGDWEELATDENIFCTYKDGRVTEYEE